MSPRLFPKFSGYRTICDHCCHTNSKCHSPSFWTSSLLHNVSSFLAWNKHCNAFFCSSASISMLAFHTRHLVRILLQRAILICSQFLLLLDLISLLHWFRANKCQQFHHWILDHSFFCDYLPYDSLFVGQCCRNIMMHFWNCSCRQRDPTMWSLHHTLPYALQILTLQSKSKPWLIKWQCASTLQTLKISWYFHAIFNKSVSYVNESSCNLQTDTMLHYLAIV